MSEQQAAPEIWIPNRERRAYDDWYDKPEPDMAHYIRVDVVRARVLAAYWQGAQEQNPMVSPTPY